MKIGRMPVMIAIAAGLGWMAYQEYFGASPEAPGVRPRPSTSGAAPPNRPKLGPDGALRHPLAGLAIDDLRDTIARPLFEPTRRPIEPAKAAPVAAPVAPTKTPPPPAKPLAAKLVGVVASDKQTTAILARTGGPNVRVEQGDVVDGWEVVRIQPTEVTLTRDGRQMALKIFRK